jgi:hypothetical protein
MAVVGKAFAANLLTVVVGVVAAMTVAATTVAAAALHPEVAVSAGEHHHAMPKQYP